MLSSAFYIWEDGVRRDIRSEGEGGGGHATQSMARYIQSRREGGKAKKVIPKGEREWGRGWHTISLIAPSLPPDPNGGPPPTHQPTEREKSLSGKGLSLPSIPRETHREERERERERSEGENDKSSSLLLLSIRPPPVSSWFAQYCVGGLSAIGGAY